MKVKTTRFGEIETEFDRVIRFPRGILGFPEYREYVLLQTNEEGTFFWLQSTENPALAFVVSDPMLFVPEYQVPLKMEEFADIALARDYNLSGVPALVLNDQYLVVGAQPYAYLKQAIEQVASSET